MKKSVTKLLGLVILLALGACGGNKGGEDANLTPLQKEAVANVKAHLERGDKLMEATVVEEPMPAAIIEQPFLNLRNAIFKAGLDYQSCKTRGLEAGMEMAQAKLDTARNTILDTEAMLQKNIGDQNSVIVLAKVKAHKSVSGNPQSLVVVFDAQTMEIKEWIPVTVPVQNTVAMVICAQDNTLSEYAKEQNHEAGMLVSKTTDPVLKFILEAHAL